MKPPKYPHVTTTLYPDPIRLTVELRAPMRGEIGYWVSADADPGQALAEVLALADRDDPTVGLAGHGWRADHDVNDGARTDGTQPVTLTATWDTEPGHADGPQVWCTRGSDRFGWFTQAGISEVAAARLMRCEARYAEEAKIDDVDPLDALGELETHLLAMLADIRAVRRDRNREGT